MPEQTETCPLCGYTGPAEEAVYTHVVTSHRKRSIATELLETSHR